MLRRTFVKDRMSKHPESRLRENLYPSLSSDVPWPHVTYRNYNYGSASKALGADLLAEPELVSKDATMFFKSAIWVWMSSEDVIPSGHDVMTGPWSPSASDIAANRLPGFGATMDVLEGNILCGHESPEAAARTENYVRIAKLFHVSAGPNLHCETMLPFN